MGVKLGYGRPGRRSVALPREAAVAFGVLVLLLNIAAGALSLSHFGTARGLAYSQEGKVGICSGGGMHFLGTDGKVPPGGPDEPRQWQHGCTCCVSMQAGAAPPRPAAGLKPAEHTGNSRFAPGRRRASRSCRRSNAPQSRASLTSIAVPGFARLRRDAVGKRLGAFEAFAQPRRNASPYVLARGWRKLAQPVRADPPLRPRDRCRKQRSPLRRKSVE